MRPAQGWHAVWRLAWALTLVSATSGCGAQLFLRVDRREVDQQLVFLLGGGGNSAVFTHGRSALLIDPKFSSAARRLRADVEDVQGHAVRRLVLTHAHVDHTGGVELYRRAGAVLVHPNARRRLEASGVRAPWVEVEDEVRLVLGGEGVRVKAVGPAHSDGDLVVLFERRRLLLTGDLFLNGWEPVIDVEAGGDPLALRAALTALLTLEFDTVLPGHGEPASRAELERTRDYLAAVEAAVQSARARGLTEDATVAEVTLPAFELRPVPFGANREKTVRLVYRALAARGP